MISLIHSPPPEGPCPHACATSVDRKMLADSREACHSPYICKHMSHCHNVTPSHSHPGHSPEDEIRVKVSAEGVDGEVLSVQAHVGEEVELVPVVVQYEAALLVPRLAAPGQLSEAPLELVLVPAEDDVLRLYRHDLQGDTVCECGLRRQKFKF